jgi:hypothetical protein
MKIATVTVEKDGRKIIVNACDVATWTAQGWTDPSAKQEAEQKPDPDPEVSPSDEAAVPNAGRKKKT